MLPLNNYFVYGQLGIYASFSLAKIFVNALQGTQTHVGIALVGSNRVVIDKPGVQFFLQLVYISIEPVSEYITKKLAQDDSPETGQEATGMGFPQTRMPMFNPIVN